MDDTRSSVNMDVTSSSVNMDTQNPNIITEQEHWIALKTLATQCGHLATSSALLKEELTDDSQEQML